MIYLVGDVVVRANSKQHALRLAESDMAPRDVECVNASGPARVIIPRAESTRETLRGSGWLSSEEALPGIEESQEMGRTYRKPPERSTSFEKE